MKVFKNVSFSGIVLFFFFNLFPYLVDMLRFIVPEDNIPYMILYLAKLSFDLQTHPFMYLLINSFKTWQWILINVIGLFLPIYIWVKLNIEF